MGPARPAAAPSEDPRRRQAPPDPREPGPTPRPPRRRPALDRHRDAGPARQPDREPADGAPAPPRQLSPRVPASLGREELLPPVPDRSIAAGAHRGIVGRPPGARRGPR